MKKKFLFFVIILIVSVSCVSITGTAGDFIDGKTFSSKTIRLFQSEGRRNSRRFEIRELVYKNGKSFLEITNSSIPGLILRGNIPETNGFFEITEADFLASNLTGWNEFTIELIAQARLEETHEGVFLFFPEKTERVQISRGRIRIKNSRIGGADALRNLRNRRERIIAVTEWMKEQPFLPEFKNQKEFEDHFKPVLFPELVSKRKRPPVYDPDIGNTVRADSIRWNVYYTEMIFPEWLWELRNSGALLRDWEEAVDWFYLEYQWDSIIAAFDGIFLNKIKGD